MSYSWKKRPRDASPAACVRGNKKTKEGIKFEMFGNKKDYKEKAFFRKTTERILIEDTTEKTNIWRRIKYLFLAPASGQ